MRDQQAGMIAVLPEQPERASTAVVQNILISPATRQSTRKTRRHNRSWNSSLFRMGLMLLLMFLLITATEGFKDWSEITHLYTRLQSLEFWLEIESVEFWLEIESVRL